MKTVLLITTSSVHRQAYERGLRQYFALEFSATTSGGSGRVDAVIYDIPDVASPVDLEWLENLDLPVVVLGPRDRLPWGESSRRLVLTYPVNTRRLLEALARLGVKPEP